MMADPSPPAPPVLSLEGVGKSFVMHLQGGTLLPVVRDVSLSVAAGECVVLGGPSGAGKSSLLKIVYGNYRCDEGHVLVREGEEMVDIAAAEPRRVLRLRKLTLGYVSQFLRVIPRVGALDLVCQAAVDQGIAPDEAARRAETLLRRLNVPARLWALPPATFSGGEQQRVNIARGFVADHKVLLLDEPTASLHATNRAAVVELIHDKKRAGVALLGIFHDEDVRDRVADRIVDVTRFAAAA
jgi:alpha-D-ribose 1-methylphosphonate 5-triphosphate synthase subunit PhnL